jgi:lipoate---protein ligase
VTCPAGSPPSTAWSVEHHRGPAAAHHGLDVPDPAHRAVWAFTLDGPALVLGSTQRADDVDEVAAARLGVDVVRRRSGGGAVLLEPGDVAWIDVIVPRGDPLWNDDVAVAAEWLGRVWVAALDDLGVAGGEAHRGGLACGALGSVVCFGGTGPGEVLVGGGKVVGISQRRTRAGARFQCSVPLRWRPDRHAALLAPGVQRLHPGVGPAEVGALVDAVAVRPLAGVSADAVLVALVARLP